LSRNNTVLELIVPPRLHLVMNEILTAINNKLSVGGIFSDLMKALVLTIEFL
jgi:hypothetical protein